jgi:hypothetical protein
VASKATSSPYPQLDRRQHNEFQFLGASLDEAENISRAALSAQSLKNISDQVDSIFKLVDQVSSLDENEDDHLSRAILKQLLLSLFFVW